MTYFLRAYDENGIKTIELEYNNIWNGLDQFNLLKRDAKARGLFFIVLENEYGSQTENFAR